MVNKKWISKPVARIALAGFMFLMVLPIILSMCSTAHAAEKEFRWEQFGLDPYATSREQAMKTREDAFQKLGFPKDVIAILMVATDKPGEKVRIVNDDRFDAMISRGSVVHKNVVVAFKNKPKENGIEWAAVAEKWEVSLKGTLYTLILPEVCNNWSAIIPKLQPVVVRSLKPVAGSCPDVLTLKVNVWKPVAMNLPGVAKTHAQESIQEKYGGTPHVSRTHGKQFREANAKDPLWSTTSHGFRVSLIMTPESKGSAPTIISEKIVGDVTVVGMRELRFKRSELKEWDAIRIVPTEQDGILSPPRSSKTGFHELRFAFPEWGDECISNGHIIEE